MGKKNVLLDKKKMERSKWPKYTPFWRIISDIRNIGWRCCSTSSSNRPGPSPKQAKKWYGCWELLNFQTVVKLHENVRAEGNDSKQNLFRQLQMWVRDGHSSLEDWELLLSRNPTKVENLQNFENCAVKLSFGNEKVARDLPIIHIDA